MKTRFFYFFILFTGACTIISCQKEIDGTISGVIIPANLKPKVGTTWNYRYYTYYLSGQLATTGALTYKAKSEETIGGEKWLKIVDVATDTTVYFLSEKVDGLYLNANSTPYLFCKAPAAINDTYTVLFQSRSQDFIVKGVNDTLPTGVGDVPANYYEGFIGTHRVARVWYNKNAWIVRHFHYRKHPVDPPPSYYKYSELYIESIFY